MEISVQDIGGGRVARTFTRGSDRLLRGRVLTADELLAMPIANRRALVDGGYIEVWPKGSAGAAGPTTPGERFMVQVAKDKFDVIEGHKVNAEPLSRKAAEQLIK